jgi:hypothetical protein
MFELAGKENREVGLRFELGPKPKQFAQAASDEDPEADCQIGPSGSFTGKEWSPSPTKLWPSVVLRSDLVQ